MINFTGNQKNETFDGTRTVSDCISEKRYSFYRYMQTTAVDYHTLFMFSLIDS